MSPAFHAADLAQLASRPSIPAPAAVALRLAVVIVKWDMRHRTRRALMRLDAHELADIGLTPDDARREAALQFWKA